MINITTTTAQTLKPLDRGQSAKGGNPYCVMFTFASLSSFNAQSVETSIDTYAALQASVSRQDIHASIIDAKLGVVVHLSSFFAGDESFETCSFYVNRYLDQLVALGCHGAVDRFFTYGHWT